MRPGRGQRLRRWAVAVMPLLVAACAASTATDVSMPAQQSGQDASDSSTTLSQTSIGTGTSVAPPTTVAPTTTTSTTLVPDCVGLPGASSGDMTFLHGDVERTYKFALPPGYDGSRLTPLILNFHGQGGSAAKHDANTAMSKIAAQRGYIVVTPDGLGLRPKWNVDAGPDRDADIAFIHGLTADLRARLCIDAARIFAAGHANGGTFAAAVVCSEPFEFAAFAIVSAGAPLSCPAEVQPALLNIAGTADQVEPYDDVTSDFRGAIDVANHWAQHDACGPEPMIKELVAGVQQMAFVGCAKGDVVLLTIVDGHHPWPGGAVAENLAENSEAGKTFSATNAILDFFEGHLGA